jgi:hypothetical protein
MEEISKVEAGPLTVERYSPTGGDQYSRLPSLSTSLSLSLSHFQLFTSLPQNSLTTGRRAGRCVRCFSHILSTHDRARDPRANQGNNVPYYFSLLNFLFVLLIKLWYM